MRHRYVGIITGAQRSLRHGCHSHQVETQRTQRRMFLLDPQSIVVSLPGPDTSQASVGGGGGGGSSKASESVCLPRSEVTTFTSSDGLGASSLCGVGRRASSNTQAVDGIGSFAGVGGCKSSGYKWGGGPRGIVVTLRHYIISCYVSAVIPYIIVVLPSVL